MISTTTARKLGNAAEQIEEAIALAHLCLARRDYEEAHRRFCEIFELKQASGFYYSNGLNCNIPRLEHDVEQFEYLIKQKILPRKYSSTVAALKAFLAVVEGDPKFQGLFRFHDALLEFFPEYNRALNIYRPNAISGPALNPKLDFAELDHAYLNSNGKTLFFDSLLTPEAMREIRRFCLESVVWFGVSNGYLGAGMENGFTCGLLFQIARELQEKFPATLGDQALTAAWALKHSQTKSGVGLHADSAKVNFNLWLTPDAANLDPAAGGLVIHQVEPPAHWPEEKYNGARDLLANYLKENPCKTIRVPYKANRVVVFNSKYIHASDQYRFKPGYENRRINLTFLFGKPGT